MSIKYEKQTLAQVRKVLGPLDYWGHKCHGASAEIVKAELFECRVARGFCKGVASQHSWVVVGDDCYAEHAAIIDPTLWSYDDSVKGIWTGTLADGRHRPHGRGSIWEWGKPTPGTGEPIDLEPVKPFSESALRFLEVLGPLDRDGWSILAHAPVEDWPADEILPAINDTIGPLVPIDIIGMLTDRNPAGLYLAGDGDVAEIA